MALVYKTFAFCVFLLSFRDAVAQVVSFDEWWGPDDLSTENDTSIRPFTIHFEDDVRKFISINIMIICLYKICPFFVPSSLLNR